MTGWRACAAGAVLAAQFCFASATLAATVPDGFVDSVFVDVPSDTTAMQFAPDGRLFICQQSGKLRVVQNGTLLATPFLTVPVNDEGERGLLGVAFDPDFETNNFVYVYYTATSPNIHNRLSRFTANDNVAVPGSEVVLLNLNALSGATNHNGGAIHFGNDDKLYIAVGDNANHANSQSFGNLLGKVLRLNRDGSIPANNPFFGTASGVNRSIWALGLRNPFTMAFERNTERLFINDVGENTWEEINLGAAGANYGWRAVGEGPPVGPPDPDFTYPFYSYRHGSGATTGCAVTGGAFYESAVLTFPTAYRGDYFYADYCSGWIRRIDPDSGPGSDTSFASGISFPVDLKVGPDGSLYYLARGNGVVGRISFADSEPPTITLQPVSRTIAIGQSATFTVGATGSTPLRYRWRRNGNTIPGATAPTYTRANAQFSDNGARFDVVVSNDFGSDRSNAAQLTVTQNTPPTASIAQPASESTYAGGNVISYAGMGSDAEDGPLPASAFTWWVDFYHDDGQLHSHPIVLPPTPPLTSGSKIGSFTVSRNGHLSANVFYRIKLKVRDSDGAESTVVSRDIQPRKATVTLATVPAGLQLRLDGQPVTTPHSFVSVVGIQRGLEAVSPQGSQRFSSWTDGGARVHTILTPATNTTYTARFTTQPTASIRIANVSRYEGNSGSSAALFNVTLSAARSAPVSVSWRTTRGSAKSGTDYTAANGTLTFPAGATSRTIPVSIRGDTTVEGNEVFYVDLTAPSGATIADARAAGSILNDDGTSTFSFSAASYRKTENGGSVTITVRRTGGLAGGRSVRYSTANGTASAGPDYTARNGTLTFGAGVETASFQVPIMNDALDEANETVNLSLSSPSSGAVLGTRRTATLTVVDNDEGGTLNFSAGAYERSETSGSATIRVLRTGGAANGVSVRYSTSPGTAHAAADYASASGTLNFVAGQWSAAFAVPLRNDTVNEANETVRLALSGPTGGATLGTRPTAVLTLLDDE